MAPGKVIKLKKAQSASYSSFQAAYLENIDTVGDVSSRDHSSDCIGGGRKLEESRSRTKPGE